MNRLRRLCAPVMLGICVTLGCSHALAEPPAAPIPFKRAQVSDDIDIPRVLAALMVCAALAGGVVYMIRRHYPSAGAAKARQRSIRLIDTQRLNPRAQLYVVEFAGSQYLLAHGEHGITCVATAAASPSTPLEHGHGRR